jgi:hypothetical protein
MRDTVEPHRRRDQSKLGSESLEIAIWTVIAFAAAVTVMGTVVTLTGGADQVAQRRWLLQWTACTYKGECDSGDQR